MDGRTDGRTDVRKAFYNLPSSAFGRRREIMRDQTPFSLSTLIDNIQNLFQYFEFWRTQVKMYGGGVTR